MSLESKVRAEIDRINSQIAELSRKSPRLPIHSQAANINEARIGVLQWVLNELRIEKKEYVVADAIRAYNDNMERLAAWRDSFFERLASSQ